MASGDQGPTGPDLSKGVPVNSVPEGSMMAGHIGDDEVLLARQSGRLFALSAHCTHYHGPLVDGLLVGATVRCPWHHAHFSLETGEAITAPALSPLTCWHVSGLSAGAVIASPVSRLKCAWCQGQRTVAPTSRPSTRGPW